jgi:hypothetical protein
MTSSMTSLIQRKIDIINDIMRYDTPFFVIIYHPEVITQLNRNVYFFGVYNNFFEKILIENLSITKRKNTTRF